MEPTLLISGDNQVDHVDGADSGDANAFLVEDGAEVYAVTEDEIRFSGEAKIKIPVPEGHTLHAGLHGTGPGISINGIQGAAIPLNSTTRTNIEVPGPTIAAIEFLGGTHTVSGLIVQILPHGQVPDKGGFLPGVGHSELALNGDTNITSYSANLPNAQTGISADFIEVGAWQH